MTATARDDLTAALKSRIADGVAANAFLTTTACVTAEEWLAAFTEAMDATDGYARFYRFTDRAAYEHDITKALREADLDFLHRLHTRPGTDGYPTRHIGRLLALLPEPARRGLLNNEDDATRSCELGFLFLGAQLMEEAVSP
jgi:hypothetical protein